jgi:sulfofructose kinase
LSRKPNGFLARSQSWKMPDLPLSAWDVVGVGANSVDSFNLLPEYPQPSGPAAKMRIRRHALFCGGQTATALSTCASFGLRAKYIGAIGADANGRRARDELTRRGVDLSDAITRDAPNQFAVVLVAEHAGERIVLWDRDERLRLHREELPAAAIAAARIVHVDDVDGQAALWTAELARQAGVPVTSDIESATDLTESLIAAVTYPVFAEQTPLELTGATDIEQALFRLRRHHPQMLCVTLGARGAMALAGDRLHYQPGFEVEVADTTGAGDVFRGAFIYAVLHGFGVDETLQFANAAAAVSCSRLGAIPGVPTLEETQALAASRRFRE